MENTLFSCTTRDPAQLVWTQFALTHFGSEISGPNSSMATMQSRKGGLLWLMPLLQHRSSFAILTHSPLVLKNLFSCRSCDILKQPTALLPYNFNQKVFPTVWISHVAADASAQMFPAPSGAGSLNLPYDLKFPAWSVPPVAHLFTKGQHETQPVIQFAPFSAVSLIISALP